MATKKTVTTTVVTDAPDPKKLDECTFFKRLGFELSEEQKKLRDAIYSPDIDIIFVNSPAGGGKTVISLATALLMVECGRYDEIIYCFSMSGGVFDKMGFLPGTAEDKERGFYEPCEDALIACGYQPEKVIKELNPDGVKSGSAFISCRSHAFMRGITIGERAILCIDEAQNFYIDELKKVLTRVKDGTKVIVLGHTGQIDILKHPEYSGFDRYIELFKDKERCAVCELTQNFRGWISQLADSLDIDNFRKEATNKAREDRKLLG